MRGLTSDEVETLREELNRSGEVVEASDTEMVVYTQLVARGLLRIVPYQGEDCDLCWAVTDLGMLALRIHSMLQYASV